MVCYTVSDCSYSPVLPIWATILRREMSQLNPVTIIDPRNHESGADIQRVNRGEDVHEEIDRLDLHADLT